MVRKESTRHAIIVYQQTSTETMLKTRLTWLFPLTENTDVTIIDIGA